MSRKVVALIFVLFCTAGVAHAQSIRGKVIVSAPRPPEHIDIYLESAGRVVKQTYADSSGSYLITGMPFGAYDVVARADGYEESRTRVELSAGPAGDRTPIVNLLLEQKPILVPVETGALVGDVTQLSRNYPKKVLQDFDQGIEASQKGNVEKALGHLEAVVKEAPEFYDALNLLGSLYQRLNRFRDAEKEFHLAREVNPRSALPMVNLGNLYIQEADSTDSAARPKDVSLNDALDSLDEAVKLDSQSAVAFYLRGLAYYRSGDNSEAETSLKRALQLDTHMGASHLVLINLYTREEEWQSALNHLNVYLTENPKAPNRAQLESARQKLTESLQGQPK